jgi:hypothetical protein
LALKEILLLYNEPPNYYQIMSDPEIVLPSSTGRTFALKRSSLLANAISFLEEAPNHPAPVSCEVASDSEEAHIALTVLAGLLEEGGIRPTANEVIIPGSKSAKDYDTSVGHVESKLDDITSVVVESMCDGTSLTPAGDTTM